LQRGRELKPKEMQRICRELAGKTTDSIERAALLELAENYQEACITTNTKLPITAISQISESPK
jgi:hypothetical protein